MRTPIPTPTPQGWICPKCGRVYSPRIPECTHCNRGKGAAPVEPPPKLPRTDREVAEAIEYGRRVAEAASAMPPRRRRMLTP